MKIQKRDGSFENMKFDKITARIKRETYGLSPSVDAHIVAQKCIDGVYDGIKTEELDELASRTAASMNLEHPDYSKLAARISITALHKDCKKDFSEVVFDLFNYIHPRTKEPAGLVSEELFNFVQENKDELNQAIVSDRDFNLDYFGFKTLQRSYLLKMNGKVAEKPQFMWMRVACGLWTNSLEKALKTYELLSSGAFSCATPTLFNSGTQRPQLASCFLLKLDDSLESITKVWSDVANISKWSGGIGVSLHDIRSDGAFIKGINAEGDGIIPLIKSFESIVRYIKQGMKRKGSVVFYLETWHSQISEFLDLRKNNGAEELRARDIFTALWVPDLFFEKVKSDDDWTLFSPDEAPGLDLVWGKEFETLYKKYVDEGRGRETVKAREIWSKIIDSQLETGTPYILSKDRCNERSNQKNLGTIRQSNLCAEIIEYTSTDEQAVCTLASIALPHFVKKDGSVDFNYLKDVSYHVAETLNRIIDINYYPTQETKNSNFRHRPIGIGIMGLSDLFAMKNVPFDSSDAIKIDADLMETIYFGAMTASKDLAKKDGPYSTYQGSPISEGKFQFNLAGLADVGLSGRWDWQALREEISKYGVRNSLLCSGQPTATTSQILGWTECFEPMTANIYSRSTLSGDFMMVNRYLASELAKIGMWTENIRNQIIANNGSVQNIENIPDYIKIKFKTAWEMSQKWLIDMSASRQRFICQSQSLNLFFEDPTAAKISSALFYGYEKGLKTLVYYTRVRHKNDSVKTLAVDMEKPIYTEEEALACSLENPEACEACSS